MSVESMKALFQLGTRYEQGQGVVKDQKEAVKCFQLAADQGYAAAQFALGLMHMYDDRGVFQNHKEAANWYRLAAAQGYVSAQFALGDMYKDGLGVVQNYVQAHMWYNLCAAHGYSEASELRDEVATKMTSAQIAQAQEMAHVQEMAQRCQAASYKNCD